MKLIVESVGKEEPGVERDRHSETPDYARRLLELGHRDALGRSIPRLFEALCDLMHAHGRGILSVG